MRLRPASGIKSRAAQYPVGVQPKVRGSAMVRGAVCHGAVQTTDKQYTQFVRRGHNSPAFDRIAIGAEQTNGSEF